jgi:hypothetical protein
LISRPTPWGKRIQRGWEGEARFRALPR